MTFSDGTPLDASAVVANLDIWYAGRRNEGINPIGLFPKTYDHAEAVDAATVKVFFKAPTLGFIPTLGYHGSILISPKTIAQPASEQADLAKTSGSGPYVVDSWKEGDFVKLVKRKDYNWGPAAVGHTGPAYLDSITYKLVVRAVAARCRRPVRPGRRRLQRLAAGTEIPQGRRASPSRRRAISASSTAWRSTPSSRRTTT